MQQLRISEIAEQGRVNLQTIRYYEREGLLPKPPRLPSGYRVFSPETVLRVQFIKRAQDLGFSLREIKELLALRAGPGADQAEVKRIASDRLADIEAKMAALQRMKITLEQLVDACPGHGATSECPILDCLERGERKNPLATAAANGGGRDD